MNGIGEDLISSIDIKALFSSETSNLIDVLGLDGVDQLLEQVGAWVGHGGEIRRANMR